MESNTSRKLLRAACHGAALVNWTLIILGVPLAAWMLSEDPLVRDSAKEALNFSISMYIWVALCTGLLFTLIGIPAAIVGFIVYGVISTIFPLIAIVSVCIDPDRRFRYPLTIRLIPTEKDRAKIPAAF